jgi:hypothetical protein
VLDRAGWHGAGDLTVPEDLYGAAGVKL